MDLTPFDSCVAIATAIRSSRVRSRDVLEMYVDRCIGRGRELNAVVTLDLDSARRAADACDRAVADKMAVGPLHGVPMTVKDAFTTAGLRSTSGLPEYARDVPTEDSVVVSRLRSAGAVIFGKTNVPRGITGQETANSLFGRTTNPWDLSRTPGGSSGGAAAAVAAGLTAAEIGSDSGGSIRQPAHCCGIFGHVPTHGLVPLRGHRPQAPMHLPGLDVDLMDIGPLSRSAGDLAHLLQVLIGADPVVGIGAQPLLRQPDKLLTELRIGVWADDPHCPTSSDVLGALQYAADEIARAGGNVDDHAQPAFSLEEAWEVSFRLWVAASSARTDDDEFTRLSNLAVDGNEPNHVAVIRAAAETMSHRDWLRLDQRRRELLGDWMRFFEDIDLLLCPVIPVVAPEHDSTSDLDAVASVDHRLARHIDVDGTQRPYLDQLTWNILTNAPGLPVTVAPIGITPAGLPIGAQLVGPRYADLRTIRAAGELAELIEGYRRPAGW